MKLSSVVKLLPIFTFLLRMSLLDASLAQQKPLLSEAIRKAIDTQGIKAAKKEFAGLNQTERDGYDIDMNGISELTSEYIRNGNMEAAGAVSEIAAPFLQDMISKSSDQHSSEWSENMNEKRWAEKEQRAKERQEERKRKQQEQIVDFQGEPRSDLERFTGL